MFDSVLPFHKVFQCNPAQVVHWIKSWAYMSVCTLTCRTNAKASNKPMLTGCELDTELNGFGEICIQRHKFPWRKMYLKSYHAAHSRASLLLTAAFDILCICSSITFTDIGMVVFDYELALGQIQIWQVSTLNTENLDMGFIKYIHDHARQMWLMSCQMPLSYQLKSWCWFWSTLVLHICIPNYSVNHCATIQHIVKIAKQRHR